MTVFDRLEQWWSTTACGPDLARDHVLTEPPKYMKIEKKIS